MLRSTKLFFLGHVLIVGALATGVQAPSPARAEAKSRAVNVIDAPTPGAAAGTPVPAVPSADDAPILAPRPAPAVPMPSGPVVPAQPDNGPATRVKAINAAGLSVEMSPDAEIAVGTTVTFRISTRKEGYLLLLDVDANGKLTQIYPNPLWLMNASGGRQKSNVVKPGKPALIPDPTDHAGFEFVASPPLGTAMVVALLSDRPVHMIDLPDVPVKLMGQPDALDHLSTMAHALRIPSGATGPLQEARWSLDAKFYSVR